MGRVCGGFAQPPHLAALSRQQSPFWLHRLSHQQTPSEDLLPQELAHEPPHLGAKSAQQSPAPAHRASQ